MNSKLALAALTLALAGCSLAPAYQRPAAPLPSAWPDQARALPGERLAHADGWQDYFSDPRLQALIAASLENNRDLRIATARIAEARAQYGIQQADRLPNFNLSANRNASLTPAGASAFSPNALHSQRYDVSVGLTAFELDFWGRVASLNAAAKASYLATESAQRAFRLSLISDVANAYLSVLELRERSELAKSAAEARAESRMLASRRRELGASGDLDYLQVEAAYQAALAEQANLARQLAAAGNLLDLLVGRGVTGMNDLPAGRPLAAQDIGTARIADLPAEALLRRPDVVAAEQRLIASNANIGAARAAFLPRIALTGSAGTASRTLTGLFDAGSGAWSFQPSITLPLFDAGRNSANVDLAEARKVIAVAEYEKTLQQAFREVSDLLSARARLAEQLAAQQANATAQAQLLTLVDARYQAGIANRLELLDAQSASFTSRQNELQLRRTLLTATAQLYKALARGADDLSETETAPRGVATK
ncbi:MAG TPA: efflux transporter outer membrane subunit [Gallionella sp.]|nr:efflux transporter outer membrane subunit [Gallionella sp.]